LRIIHAYGNSLHPEAWAVCIKSVIFRLLASVEDRLRASRDPDARDAGADWSETAVVIVDGVSGLLADYLDVLTAHPTFASLWQELMRHFATMLDFKALDINSATFKSLGNILSKCDDTARRRLDKKTIDIAWELWARGLPVPEEEGASKLEDNQKCLLAWVEALLELHRLMASDLDLARVQRMLDLLRQAMMLATPGTYATDIEYATPVQAKILDVFKLVRSDIPGAPSVLISQLAEFVSLAFTTSDQGPNRKRTFVAMSKNSMPILHYHVTQNASDAEIYASKAFSTALSALATPIILKYRFPIVTKSVQPWREATTATLAVLEATLPHLKEDSVPSAAFQETWRVVVSIANGIISAGFPADGTDAHAEDQQFDIDAFHKLRELVIPLLGAEAIPEKTRRSFAEGLFRTSIIHPPAPTEADLIYGNTGQDIIGKGLSEFSRPRCGRTVDPPPTRRENMSYVCLDELFSLVATHDETADTPSIVVVPPTPRFPKKMTHPGSSGTATAGNDSIYVLHSQLARTAAPYLILRCALSIRAYNADHPLRGHMPQPLSQRKEVYHILRRLVDLQSEPGCMGTTPGVESESRKHLLRLYPMLVRAIQVAGAAGDDKILALAGEALEVVGGEFAV